MEWVIAFVIFFAPGDMPDNHTVHTDVHALRVCQKEFPKGRVQAMSPLTITLPTGNKMILEYIWACQRLIKKA